MIVHLTVSIRANVSQHAKQGPREVIAGQSSIDWGEQQRAHPQRLRDEEVGRGGCGSSPDFQDLLHLWYLNFVTEF